MKINYWNIPGVAVAVVLTADSEAVGADGIRCNPVVKVAKTNNNTQLE